MTFEERDRGAATSLTLVLLTPVLVVIAFAALQAAMWSHARTEARVIARDTAALVARGGLAGDVAEASARRVLTEGTDLRHVDVAVAASARLVRVTVSGDAPGILRGTRSGVSVTAAVPVEGWVP
jgi:hypothetical protein